MSATGALSVVTYDAAIVRAYCPKWHLVRATNAKPSMTWRRREYRDEIRWEFRDNSDHESVTIAFGPKRTPRRVVSSFPMSSARYIRASKTVTVEGVVFDARVTLVFKLF